MRSQSREPLLHKHCTLIKQQAPSVGPPLRQGGKHGDVCVCRWRILSRLPRSLGLVLKALMQALWLLAMLLLWMPSPDVILLQVPFS